MDRRMLEAWLEGYIRAWNSNDPHEIGGLFAEDACYYTAPHREPWRGRAGIVAGWLGRKDEPGSFTFRHQVLAATPELGIVRGWTRYADPPQEYSNLWLIALDEQGRCVEFTEWWMEAGE